MVILFANTTAVPCTMCSSKDNKLGLKIHAQTLVWFTYGTLCPNIAITIGLKR